MPCSNLSISLEHAGSHSRNIIYKPQELILIVLVVLYAIISVVEVYGFNFIFLRLVTKTCLSLYLLNYCYLLIFRCYYKSFLFTTDSLKYKL